MGVQVGKESEFPFQTKDTKKCWYLITFVRNGKLQYEVIPYNYPDTLACVAKAVVEGATQDKVLIFGIWHGMYRTDLFLLDPNRTLEELKKRGIECLDANTLRWWKQRLGLA